MTVATRRLRLGTRGSALARAQSGLVAEALTAASGAPVELVTVTTYGDTDPRAVTTLGGTGVFVAALRERLLAGDVDLAVHSMKDLPTEPAPGLTVAAVPVRSDPRDALVAAGGRTLATLPAGATVGTGSPRRAAQLHALGRGLVVRPIRGNVDTRVRAVADGTLDAVVVARAGLLRLGRADAATEVLDPEVMLPAPAQGALAVECRSDDTELVAALAALDDPTSRATASAERALLRALQAGCTAPVAALAETVAGADGPELRLRGLAAAPDGSTLLRSTATGHPEQADDVGARLAAELLGLGAAELMGGPP